jgi:hypothetical protein
MADVAVARFRIYCRRKLAPPKCECHAITNTHPEAAVALQRMHKLPGDIEDLVGGARAELGESCEWIYIGKSA